MNPTTTGVGGNTSLPPPVKLDSGNAPVPPAMLPLGEITPRGTDGDTLPSPALPAAGNGTGNKDQGENPLTSGVGVNATPTTTTTNAGNGTVYTESMSDLADEFQKVLRAEQEGLSPELKNQSPQEKHLRSLALLNKYTLMGMKDEEQTKAIHYAFKVSNSWLQTYLQSMAQEKTLAPVRLVQDLKDVSDSQDVRKYLDENLQHVTFGDKVVAVTSPGFLLEHAKPPVMMRKCAIDLIKARSLMDYSTDTV
jgi:hypothetical protein